MRSGIPTAWCTLETPKLEFALHWLTFSSNIRDTGHPLGVTNFLLSKRTRGTVTLIGKFEVVMSFNRNHSHNCSQNWSCGTVAGRVHGLLRTITKAKDAEKKWAIFFCLHMASTMLAEHRKLKRYTACEDVLRRGCILNNSRDCLIIQRCVRVE